MKIYRNDGTAFNPFPTNDRPIRLPKINELLRKYQTRLSVPVVLVNVCISVPLWQIRIFGLFFSRQIRISGFYPDFLCKSVYAHGMVWYGMVNVDLYSAIITKVSNALNTLVSGDKPGFQTLSKA